MDELDRAVEASLKGPLAERALANQHRQMQQWGITLPPGRAVVLDFGLGQFDEIGEIEHWIANEVEKGYCGKFLFLQDGQTCPTHCHKEKHETFFVVKGSVLMVVDGVERKLDEGDVLAVDQGNPHRFTGLGPALILEISKPCLLSDNYFDNPDVNIGHAYVEQRHLAAHRAEPMDGARRPHHVASDGKRRSESLEDA
jgi:mannose-6-phosphate isomerase-like protein (cupin superfamily)